MKKILFIAFHFHPDVAVGALRTVKFVKYLPSHGWQPHVLTVDPTHYPRIDPTPMGVECPVTRTGVLPRLDDIYRRIRTMSRIRPKSQGSMKAGKGSSGPRSPVSLPWWKRLANTISNTPDAQSGWYWPAVRAAMRLTQRERFDAIYSSGPPNTCHLIGLTVATRTRLPWIIDFRDPWYVPGIGSPNALQWSRDFNRRKEREAVAQAALVVTTTPEWRDRLVGQYGDLIDGKCVSIQNGFDEEEFPSLASVPVPRPEGPMTFLHGGSLYMGRDPGCLLRAIHELLMEEGSVRPEDVRFRFVGDLDIDMARVRGIVEELRLENVVSFSGGVPRSEYLKMALESDVLLLMQADLASVNIPAKAFEYLATGNRILVLAGEGSTRNLMAAFDHVFLARMDDKEEIKAAIKSLVRLPRHQQLSSDAASKIAGLTKKRLAKTFSEHLSVHVDGGSGIGRRGG